MSVLDATNNGGVTALQLVAHNGDQHIALLRLVQGEHIDVNRKTTSEEETARDSTHVGRSTSTSLTGPAELRCGGLRTTGTTGWWRFFLPTVRSTLVG